LRKLLTIAVGLYDNPQTFVSLICDLDAVLFVGDAG
jgi:hypothetical protein